MGLFKELDSDTQVTVEAMNWTRQLRQAVVSSTASRMGWSPRQWVKEFQTLNRQVNDQARIGMVLAWYCAHIGEPYVPQAFCAHSFRRAFLRIEQAMLRSQRERVELNAEGQAVDRELRRLSWGVGRLEELAAAIHASQEGHAELQTRIAAHQGRVTGTATYILVNLRQWLGRFSTFYPVWVGTKLEQYRKWELWSGSLGAFRFGPHHRDVVAKIKQLSRQHSGMETAADAVLQLLEINHAD